MKAPRIDRIATTAAGAVCAMAQHAPEETAGTQRGATSLMLLIRANVRTARRPTHQPILAQHGWSLSQGGGDFGHQDICPIDPPQDAVAEFTQLHC